MWKTLSGFAAAELGLAERFQLAEKRNGGSSNMKLGEMEIALTKVSIGTKL